MSEIPSDDSLFGAFSPDFAIGYRGSCVVESARAKESEICTGYTEERGGREGRREREERGGGKGGRREGGKGTVTEYLCNNDHCSSSSNTERMLGYSWVVVALWSERRQLYMVEGFGFDPQ